MLPRYWPQNLLRRRKHNALLAQAATWPTAAAKLLAGKIVSRDPLAEGGTSFQDSQVESPYFFTVNGSYFGGHLRGVPMSDSEAHRALKLLPEDMEVTVRYNPANPDQTATLPDDKVCPQGTLVCGLICTSCKPRRSGLN